MKAKVATTKPTRTRQRALLASVSAIALSTALIGAAPAPTRAATTLVNLAGTEAATGHISEALPLTNTGEIRAAITASSASEDVAVGSGDPITATASENILNATAIGNRIARDEGGDDTIDLGLLDNEAGDGIAVLGSSVNATGAVVTSGVNDSSVSVLLTDLTEGAAANTGNTVQALTMLNSSTLTASGAIPNDYASTTAGGISLAFDPAAADPATNALSSTGSVAVSSHQLNNGVGPNVAGLESSASLDGNGVTLTLTPTTADQTVESSPDLSGNTLSASYAGNAASTSIAAETGGAPTFEGSAALSNVQSNLGGGTGSLNAAENLDSQVAAVVGDDAGGTGSSTLAGTLSVADNTISSAATGNQALASSGYGNSLSLADGLSFDGPDTAIPAAGSTVGYDTDGVNATVTADLALLSNQANVDTSHSSLTEDAEISALTENLVDGAVDVSGNAVRATATGNTASSAILAPGAALDPDEAVTTAAFTGSAALANAQVNDGSAVEAAVNNPESGDTIVVATVGIAGAEAGALTDGAVTVDGNTVSATANGNDATNAVALGATDVALDGGLASVSGGHLADGEVTPTAGATLANLQANYSSAVEAENTGSLVGLIAADLTSAISGATLTNADNTVNALAKGNSAGNTLALEATSLTGGAALGNVQVNDGGSSGVSATVTDAQVAVDAGTDGLGVTDSTLALTGNTVRATGYGSTASNALSAAAQDITAPTDGFDGITGTEAVASEIAVDLAAADGLLFDADSANLPSAEAGFALLNVQGTSTSTAADAAMAGSGTPFTIEVGDDVAGSTVTNGGRLDGDTWVGGNAYIADAYANQAGNTLDIDAGTLASNAGGDDAYAPVASLTNAQTRGDGAEVTADVATGDAEAIETLIDGSVTGSEVTASGNLVQALARGNIANGETATPGNTLTVSGTTITAAPSAAEGALGGLSIDLGTDNALTSDLAFTVQNAQAGGSGQVAATVDGSGALLDVAGSATNSSLQMEANRFLAGAYDNGATNTLAIDGATVTASGGVQSFQLSDAATAATLGTEGTPPRDAEPFTYTLNVPAGFSYDGTNTELDNASGGVLALTIDGDTLTADQRDYLLDQGWSEATPGGDLELVVADGGSYDLSDENFTALADATGSGATAGAAAQEGEIPASLGVAASPAVLITVDGNVSGSTLAIAGTVPQAAAVSNTAANILDVTADVLNAGAGLAAGAAQSSIDHRTADTYTALADYAVSNVQILDDNATATAEANSTVGIDVTEGASAITGSTLSVTDTRQQATAQGNLASNSLSLDVTATAVADGALAPTASVLSSQDGTVTGTLSATSSMEVYAPGAIGTSDLTLSGNQNTALGVVNDVANALTVSGTNLATANAAATNAVASTGTSAANLADADYVVNSAQESSAVVTSTAESVVYNQDRVSTATSGLQTGTAALSDNLTTAQATANRSNNTLALDGGSTLAATGAVLNWQSSSSPATAAALGEVAFDLTAEDATAAGTASVDLTGNRTTALARGNDAANALNALASAAYGALDAAGATSSSSPTALSATAAYAVLNDQGNSGAVTASATGTYEVALNAGGTATEAVSGSSVALSGNRIDAEAMGNRAANSLTLTALAGGTPTAALTSVQDNSGAITASVANATIGVQAGAAGVGAVGSGFRVGGNQITATAVGNGVTSSIVGD